MRVTMTMRTSLHPWHSMLYKNYSCQFSVGLSRIWNQFNLIFQVSILGQEFLSLCWWFDLITKRLMREHWVRHWCCVSLWNHNSMQWNWIWPLSESTVSTVLGAIVFVIWVKMYAFYGWIYVMILWHLLNNFFCMTVFVFFVDLSHVR